MNLLFFLDSQKIQSQKKKKANLKISHLFSLKESEGARHSSPEYLSSRPVCKTTDIHLRVSMGRDF